MPGAPSTMLFRPDGGHLILRPSVNLPHWKDTGHKRLDYWVVDVITMAYRWSL